MSQSEQVTLGAYLSLRLEEIGIKDYFAIPGDFNLLMLDEMLKNKNLRMINCCNELNAGYAADCYGRVKKVSALFVTFSVGGLSAINAVAGAYAEDSPLIVVSGGPNTSSSIHHPILHHTLGERSYDYVREMYAKVTAHAVIICDPLEAPHQIDKAIMIALKKRKPVYLEIACNICNTKVSKPQPIQLFPSDHSDLSSLKAAVDHVASFLNNAQKPVIVAGGKLRAWQGIEPLQNLVEACNYPVACMPDAKGFFPETNPHFIGIYWGSVSSVGCGEIVESSDAYLFVCPRFTDYTTVGYTTLLSSKKLVFVGTDFVQLEGQIYNNIDPKDLLKSLKDKLKSNTTSLSVYNRIKEKEKPLAPLDMNAPITTRRLFTRIQEMLNVNSGVLAETGDSWFNGLGLSLPENCGYESQMQYGSIGWSVGALLGYAIASPGRKVIGLIGDGSFQMGAQEISTFIRYNIPAVIFLMNNASYGIEVQIHDGIYNEIQNWHYAKLVDVFNRDKLNGIGFTVCNEKQLLEAIAKANSHNGLSFIEVILDRNDCNKALLEWGTRVASYNSQSIKPSQGIMGWD